MLSGDQALKAEAQRFLGDVPVAVVKRAVDRLSAEFLSPAESARRIRETAKRALEEINQRKVFTFEPPVTMGITMTSPTLAMMASLMPGSVRNGAAEVTFTHDDYLVVYRFMIAALVISMFCTDPDF